jgi:hypothetical protein
LESSTQIPLRIGGRDLVTPCFSQPALDKALEPLFKMYPDLKLFGILGFSFLKGNTVRLDYLERKFSLWAPEALPLPSKETLDEDHVLLDFVTDAQGHLFIEDGAVGETLKGRLHLDIGSPQFNFSRKLAQKADLQGNVIPLCKAGDMAFKNVSWMERDFQDVFPQWDLIGELGNAQLMNAVVTIHYAHKKLEIRRDRAATPIGFLGVLLSPVDSKVTEVKKEMLAERLGIQVGDKILSVNGRLTPNRSLMLDAIFTPTRTGKVELKILREGSELTLSGTLDEPPPR